MTRTFDKAFVALGVDADELSSLRGRWVIYSGLVLMAAGGLALGVGIFANLTA